MTAGIVRGTAPEPMVVEALAMDVIELMAARGYALPNDARRYKIMWQVADAVRQITAVIGERS